MEFYGKASKVKSRFVELEPYFFVSQRIVRTVGSDAATLLGYLFDLAVTKEKLGGLKRGWFRCSNWNVRKFLGMSNRVQQRLFKKLVDVGAIKRRLRGVPAKRYIHVNYGWLFAPTKGDSERSIPKVRSTVVRRVHYP